MSRSRMMMHSNTGRYRSIHSGRYRSRSSRKKRNFSLEEALSGGTRKEIIPYRNFARMNLVIPEKPDQSTKRHFLEEYPQEKDSPASFVYKKSKPHGISPRNVGQYFHMQEALMTDAKEAPCYHQRMAGTAENISIRLAKFEWKRYITIRHRNIAVRSYADPTHSLTMI